MKENRIMKKNFTQGRLGEKIKMDANHLSRIERGEHLPNLITFLKLSYELGLDPNDYLPTAIQIINKHEEYKI